MLNTTKAPGLDARVRSGRDGCAVIEGGGEQPFLILPCHATPRAKSSPRRRLAWCDQDTLLVEKVHDAGASPPSRRYFAGCSHFCKIHALPVHTVSGLADSRTLVLSTQPTRDRGLRQQIWSRPGNHGPPPEGMQEMATLRNVWKRLLWTRASRAWKGATRGAKTAPWSEKSALARSSARRQPRG